MKKANEYRVEAHGSGILAMRGGVGGFGGNPYAQEPMFARECAWAIVQEYMTPTFSTVKVYRKGILVFQAFRQADGSWCDWKSARTLKAAA